MPAQIKEDTLLPWRKSIPLVQLIDSQGDDNHGSHIHLDDVVALARLMLVSPGWMSGKMIEINDQIGQACAYSDLLPGRNA